MANLTEEQLRLASLAALADKTKQEKIDTKKANIAAVEQAKKDKKRVDGLSKKDSAKLEKQQVQVEKRAQNVRNAEAGEASKKKAAEEKTASEVKATAAAAALEERKKAAADERAESNRSFEDRQKKEDDRLNRRLDSQEARDKEGTVRNLADQMQEGKAGAVDDKNNADLASKLRAMNAFTNLEANEASIEMSTRFNQLVSITQDIENTSEDERRIAQLSLNELSTAASDEEERREKQAQADKANSLWGRMEEGINRSADNLEGMRNNLLKGGGIVAVLGTLAMLFLDPETLFEMIKTGMEIVRNIIQGISDFLNGDMTTKLSMVKENFGSIALAVGALTLIFLPNILRGVVRLKNILSGVGKFLGVMKKGFMLLRAAIFGAATANATAGGGVLAMFSAALVPLAPVIAIGLAIAAVIGIFALLMTKLRDSLGFSSVFDFFWIAIAGVKDAIGHFVNIWVDIINTIMNMVEKVAGWFGFEIELPTIQKVATNNTELAVQEARQKKIRADQEKEAEEQAELKKKTEEEADAQGADLVAQIEVQGPSDEELKKNETVDQFRSMMGFKAIDRDKVIDSVTSTPIAGLEGRPGVDSGDTMARTSAENAKAQADAAGRPDVTTPKPAMNLAMGGNSTSMTTFNTLAPNSSRISRLNFLNQ